MKTGRPSKGERDAFSLRPPQPLGDRIRAAADDKGMSYNDYLMSIVANAMGMPQYAPAPRTPAEQIRLPFDERKTA